MASFGDPGSIDELCAYVACNDADLARLRGAWPTLQPEAGRVVERFFQAAQDHEATRPFLTEPAALDELKRRMAILIEELLCAPRDTAYLQRRLEVGRAHVRSRLAPRFLVLAMGVLREELQAAARRVVDGAAAAELSVSLGRACDVELAILISSFVAAREQQGLLELREDIVKHLPMSVVLLDAEGRVTTSARANPRVFVDAAPHGKPWAEVLQPALVAAAGLTQRIERARSLKREILMPRVDAVLDSGPASFRVTITPLPHPVAEVLLHVEDLTDTLASEGRATRAEQLAKLGTMAATVAHEIRNPLAGVSAAVQVVASTLPPDDARRAALQKVQEQVQRLGNLVGDLLSLSKPISMNPRELDLAALARSVAESEHGTVQVSGAGFAMADGALLTQALFNLIQNAWQAGARSVRVEVQDTTLRVVDDGPGVPVELREKVFEPFFTTKTRGTGLGLPTARKIVEAMGGTLRICEHARGGGCFELQLPPQNP